jgi:prefoldin subunit 5
VVVATITTKSKNKGIAMEKDLSEALRPIKEDIRELKDTQKKLLDTLIEFAKLENRLSHYENFANEARKVIHKRIDKLENETIKSKDFMIKIIIGVSSVAVTTLLGILLGLVKV